MIFRFLVRLALLLCVALSFLIGGVVIASGRLQPVRFLVLDEGGSDSLLLMSDAGDTMPLTQPQENIIRGGGFPHENKIAWVNLDHAVIVWSHGQRQQIGHLWRNAPQNPLWSENGWLAWSEMVNGTVDLMVWDGERVHNIAPEPEDVSFAGWIGPLELAWLQAKPDGQWQLLTWNGHESTERYRSSLATDRFGPFELACGAVVVRSSPRHWLYYAGQITAVPDHLTPVQTITSDNCHTFLFDNVETGDPGPREISWPDIAWSGAAAHELDFHVEGIRGDDEFMGYDLPLETSSSLQLIYQHGTQIQRHIWQASDPIEEVTPLFWDGPVMFWRAGTPPTGIYILQWNTTTDELITFPTNTDINIGYVRDEVGRRAAWIDIVDSSVIQLHIWEHGLLSSHTLPYTNPPVQIYYRSLRWMNDGSLLVTMQQVALPRPGPLYTAIYRWDGTTLEHLTDLPFSAVPQSDWMMWE